jgi:hypothetical protein
MYTQNLVHLVIDSVQHATNTSLVSMENGRLQHMVGIADGFAKNV